MISAGSQVRILSRPLLRAQKKEAWEKAKRDRFEFERKKRFQSTNVRPARKPGWFFDIYIQGSKYNFLELSLKRAL